MSIYLGGLGRMVALKCPATQQQSLGDRFSFEPTLEGRIKAQALPAQRRSWALATSDATTPAQQATLLSFINGEWGPGPFVFVSTDAPTENLLSPAAAACREFGPAVSNVRPGGPVLLGPEDWAGSSVASHDITNPTNGREIILGTDYVPVLQGQQVTASAWVRGAAAKVRLYWYDATLGSPIASAVSVMTGTTGWSRVWVTGVPPANAVACRMSSFEAEQATRPAITWTDQPFEWAAGGGCSKAVIHGASKNLVMASRDPRGGRYANLSYTITEVG